MSPSEDNALPPSRILIADDNLQNLELVEAYMADLPGVETLRAKNGEEALTIIREEHPDLVLLDVMMPKMSGFEVCKKMKADPNTKDIPVVMITALGEPMDIERGIESGTDDYLAKPIMRQDLIDRVKSLLQGKHRTGEGEMDYMDEFEAELDEEASREE